MLEVWKIVLIVIFSIIACWAMFMAVMTLIDIIKERRDAKRKFNEAVQKRMDEVKERLQQLRLRGWQPKEHMQNKPPVTPPTKGSSAEPPKRIIIIFERTDDIDKKDGDKRN